MAQDKKEISLQVMKENPLSALVGVGLGLSLTAGIAILSTALINLTGRAVLGSLGFGALVAAAGAFWPATLAISLGLLITAIPYLILDGIIKYSLEKDHPLISFVLSLVVDIGTVCCAAMIGATILGLAANPITFCMLGGAITFALIMVGSQLIFKGLFPEKKEEQSDNKKKLSVVNSNHCSFLMSPRVPGAGNHQHLGAGNDKSYNKKDENHNSTAHMARVLTP